MGGHILFFFATTHVMSYMYAAIILFFFFFWIWEICIEGQVTILCMDKEVVALLLKQYAIR